MAVMQPFRSRLNSLPIELKMEIGEVSFQKGMLATSRRDRVIDVLTRYNIPFQNIGTGTNRHIIKYDGYVIKIALDREGVADNKQEWVMSEVLKPHVATAYEISKGGHLLVASYAPAFTSQHEMFSYRSSITKILAEWSNRFLLGDVGLTKTNYANWGLSASGKPVCIDYAYIFPVSMDIFKCVICGSKNMTMDTSFSRYKCANCQHEYEDRDLRSKISQEERLKLFQNVDGIEMTKEVEEHEVDQKFIKIDSNPDLPDPYETAYNVANHLMATGKYTNWYG